MSVQVVCSQPATAALKLLLSHWQLRSSELQPVDASAAAMQDFLYKIIYCLGRKTMGDIRHNWATPASTLPTVGLS